MSRRRRAGIVLGCCLLAALVVWLDRGMGAARHGDGVTGRRRTQADDIRAYDNRTFRVAAVVDGDTLDISVPQSRDDTTRVRLWGVDAPETNDDRTGVMYFGPEAAALASRLARDQDVTVFLDEPNGTRGLYGRLLAYVRLPDGRFLNEVLLREGYAYADLRFRHSLYHKYQQIEADARQHKKGLWGKVRQEQLPEWLQRRKPSLIRD